MNNTEIKRAIRTNVDAAVLAGFIGNGAVLPETVARVHSEFTFYGLTDETVSRFVKKIVEVDASYEPSRNPAEEKARLMRLQGFCGSLAFAAKRACNREEEKEWRKLERASNIALHAANSDCR